MDDRHEFNEDLTADVEDVVEGEESLEQEEGDLHEGDPGDEDVEEQAEEQLDEPEEEISGPRLVLRRNGQDTEHVFPLAPPCVIGRFDPSVGPVDVDLGTVDEGVYVSRKHAKITEEDGVYRIEDMGSSNGTFVLRDDFERVQEAELEPGTEIAFGNARFVFYT